MLTLLVPLLAALAVPSPAPTADASPPTPLKEIGRVQSLSVCSALVVHANGAIGAALDSDNALALAINRLRTTDLDTGNEIARRNGMNDLATIASRIRLAAAAGTGEIKRMRDMDAHTADPARKAELKAFADALAGALARQRKAGTDLARMLVLIDGRRSVAEINTPELIDERSAIAGPATSPLHPIARAGEIRSAVSGPTVEAVDPLLHTVADDFQARTQSILSDEGVAADHAIGATTGC